MKTLVKYIVIVINSIHKGRRFLGPASLCFYAIIKNMEESLEVSGLMLIFAPLKLQCGTSMPPS